MPIKTYTAKELPSGKAGGVVQPYAQPQPQMPINASSAKWDAMARLGGVVSRTANDFYKINQQLEESRQFAIAEHASNEFAQSLMKSQSEWEASKRFGDANPTAVDERATAIKEAKIELLEKYPDLNPNVRLALEKTVDSYIRRDYQESVNHVHSETKKVENDNIKATKARLILDVQNGMKSVGEAQILFAATVGKNHGNLAGIDLHFVDFEKAGRKRIYDLAWQEAMSAPTRVDAIAGIKNVDGLTPPERNALISAYKREQDFRKAKAKEQLEEVTTGIQDDFVTRTYDAKNPLTHDEIDNSILPPVGSGSKSFFHGLIDKQVKAVIDNTNLPYTTDNGKAIADILLRNADPNQKPLTSTEILAEVPKMDSYSLATAKNLIKTMDVTGSDVFKNTDTSLKSLFGYEGMLTGFGAKPLGAIFYNNAMTEILADLAKSPLKGVELRNRIYELAEPYLKEHWASSGDTPKEITARMKAMGIKQSPSENIVQPIVSKVVPLPVGSIPKRKAGESFDEFNKRTGGL